MNEAFLATSELRLHYLDHAGEGPPLILLHGLSSNAHVFDGIAARMSPRRRLLSLDLRGRGLSDKPAAGYRMADHAGDVLALLDAHGLDRATVIGHSFGGLLAYYLAARHPERVERLVVIDAARQFHPRVGELLRPSLDRLGQVYPSWDNYFTQIQATPQFDGFAFDEAALAHYRADVESLAGGAVRPRPTPEAIAQASRLMADEPWATIVESVAQPVLLLNATGAYGLPGTPPLLPAELAQETVQALPQGRYGHIPGNHMTMMFGTGSGLIAAAIGRFLAGDAI
jgi:pimeloyl-ACP methyl ester carboxylesterase